jgi:hypothetical protein
MYSELSEYFSKKRIDRLATAAQVHAATKEVDSELA